MNRDRVLYLAEMLWDYHHVNHKVLNSDCILVLGSHDTRVAERGAELYLSGTAPVLIFSGGLGNLTKGIWQDAEADKFAAIAVRMGVPEKKIAVTSPQISFADYPNDEITMNDVINIMVGGLQRIRLYPEKGYQIYQNIPENVYQAYEELKALGYTRHLVTE